MNEDMIASAVRRPIKWEDLEKLVCDVLQNDDFPGLRRMGGRKDRGIDATGSAFYEYQNQSATVVQITSEATQSYKCKRTIEKLRVNGITFDKLVLVFNAPVTPSVQAKMKELAQTEDVRLDIRDESYLIGQLSRNTGVFQRRFGDPVQYVEEWLKRTDTLGLGVSAVEAGILASVCTYGLLPEDRIKVRLTDRVVLGVLASLPKGSCERAELKRELDKHFSGISQQAIESSLTRLARGGYLRHAGSAVKMNAAKRAKLVKSMASIEGAVDAALSSIVATAASTTKFEDQAMGRADRNARQVLVDLIRSAGPLQEHEVVTALGSSLESHREEAVSAVGTGLDGPQTAALLSAIESFLGDSSNSHFVASLVRSYAVLAVSHIDPVGKRYTRGYFRDRVVLLDTDTVLIAIVSEIPESEGVLAGLKALHDSGAKLRVTADVIEEVINHAKISMQTFDACTGLKGYPEALAVRRVRNVYVRGYYYDERFGRGRGEFASYLQNYLDPRDPEGMTLALIQDRLPWASVTGASGELLEGEERHAKDRIAEALTKRKETHRRKHRYRTDAMMTSRASVDAALAILAAREERLPTGRCASGWVASDDTAYIWVERLPDWEDRERVRLRRSFLPALAELLNVRVSDAALVRLVWSPIAVSAAESIADDLELAARQGADFRRANTTRLRRQLDSGLATICADFRQQATSSRIVSDRVQAMYDLQKELRRYGYEVNGLGADLVKRLGRVEEREAEATNSAEAMRELLEALIESSSATKKYRRRIRRAVRQLGLEELLGADSDDPDNPAEKAAGS